MIRSIYLAAARPALVALLALSAPAQSVWIVDSANGPGTHFQDLPTAIAAASNGDVLRIRPGTYAAFTLARKGLRIFGAGAGQVTIDGNRPVVIGPTSAGQSIWIEGVRLPEPHWSASGGPTVSVSDAAGEVAFRGVEFTRGPRGYRPEPQLRLRRCARVHVSQTGFGGLWGFAGDTVAPFTIDASDSLLELSHCYVEGDFDFLPYSTSTGGTPLRLVRSHACIMASNLRGGGGHPGCLGLQRPGGAGGTAIVALQGSVIEIFGRSSHFIQGGPGGRDCQYPFPSYAGNGGIGIELYDSVARFEGVTPQGGIGALAGSPYLANHSASFSIRTGTLPPLVSISGTPASPSTVGVRIESSASATRLLAFSLERQFVPMPPAYFGSLLLAPLPSVLIGPDRTAGTVWEYPLSIPAGWPSYVPLFAQALVFDSAGIYFSNSVSVVIMP